MFQNSRIACILILDNEGVVMEMSSGVNKVLGYEQEDLIGKSFVNLFTDEDLKKNLPGDELKRAREQGNATDNNFLVHKNGQYILCQGESIKVDDDGEIFFVKYIYDINKRKELEESLNESKRFAESILHTIDAPLLVLDNNMQVQMSNDAFLKTFETSKEEVAKKPFFEIEKEIWDKEGLKEALNKVLSEGAQVKDFEVKINFSYGERFFHLNAQQIVEEGQKQQRILIAFHDITEERNIREHLKARNEDLDKVNKDLDMFVYTASHDLKAPVNNLEGLLNAIEEHPDCSVEITELIQMMKESVHKFKINLDELSVIGKLDQEGSQGSDDSIEFQKLFDEVIYNLDDQIKKSDASVSASFSEAPAIRFSKKNMRSVLHNLISNSIKYSSPDRKPEIKVWTRRTKDSIILNVSDNGLGIKQEDQDKIFDMYQRLDEHKHIEGSGVGMNIVKKIVEYNGGKIEVDSQPGKGSTFKIFFKVR